MLDLRKAINCIRVMKEYGTYRGSRIAIIKEDCNGMASSYKPGDVVLFTEQENRRVTIESPLCQEEIDKNKAEGSLITTIGTIINVPLHYIEEVKF